MERHERNGGADASRTHGNKHDLLAFARGFDTALLVTVTPEGLPRARPMALCEGDVPGCDLWFITSDETAKLAEIESAPEVAVLCYRDRDKAWCSMSGRARVDRDRGRIRRLWTDAMRTWLPQGPDDQHLVLLEVDVERGEYQIPQGGLGGIVRGAFDALRGLLGGGATAHHLNPPRHVEP